MNDPIPAIREDQATGEVAAVFADMRATLGVPFVNLIWRHLATMPGMLAWTWSVARPLHATPALGGAAAALRHGLALPAGLEQPAAAFETVGVTAADRRTIRAMLRDYGAANAANLLCLLLVQALLAGEAADGAAPPAPPPPPAGRRAPAVALPPLPGLDALSPAVRALVLDLDGFGRLAPTDAVASLYRHLAHWPGFLAVARAALSVPQHAGTLAALHERTGLRADALMRRHLLPGATSPAPVPEAGRAQAQAAIRSFTGQMIARMVAMGEAMLALLPPEPDEP